VVTPVVRKSDEDADRTRVLERLKKLSEKVSFAPLAEAPLSEKWEDLG